MQSDAQHEYDHEHHARAAFGVILVFGQPAGRLYVSREEDEIRIVDIALLPEFCKRRIATTLMSGLPSEAPARRQAAAHPRGTLHSRAEARVQSDL